MCPLFYPLFLLVLLSSVSLLLLFSIYLVLLFSIYLLLLSYICLLLFSISLRYFIFYLSRSFYPQFVSVFFPLFVSLLYLLLVSFIILYSSCSFILYLFPYPPFVSLLLVSFISHLPHHPPTDTVMERKIVTLIISKLYVLIFFIHFLFLRPFAVTFLKRTFRGMTTWWNEGREEK